MAALTPGSTPIHLYKNNTDNKGASYGTHENYLMSRATPFSDIVRHLTPFFVSRQVVVGSGRVGLGQDGRGHGYQLSQRADYFEVEVGLETTLKRPIINTRDEPHADPEKYRRLHVIIGDANLAEISTYLKVGTTSLVLAMIEDRFITSDLGIDGPVAALRAVSHDPTLRELIPMSDGRRLTAIQLQEEYLELARKYVDDRLGSDADAQTVDVLERWESVLARLQQDPMLCARELDWVAKLKLLNSYRDRDGLDWDSAKLQLIDYQYSDIRPDKGLYHRLVQLGRIDRLLDDASVERAMHAPPDDTRAYFRGRCLEKYADSVAAASWDSVIFDLPGRESLQRVPTIDPLPGLRKAHVAGPVLHRGGTAAHIGRRLTRRRPFRALTRSDGSTRFKVGVGRARATPREPDEGIPPWRPRTPVAARSSLRKSGESEDVTEVARETDVAERHEKPWTTTSTPSSTRSTTCSRPTPRTS